MPKVYRFGTAREFADAVDEVFAPVALEVELPTDTEPKKRRIEIVGTTQPLSNRPNRHAPAAHRQMQEPTHVLRGFLDHVLSAAAGKSSGPAHSVCLLKAGDKCESDRFDYNVFTQDEARGYLTTLLRDMLSGVHPLSFAVRRLHQNQQEARTRARPRQPAQKSSTSSTKAWNTPAHSTAPSRIPSSATNRLP